MTAFWTLLGPDFAGKSSALLRLGVEHGWQVVSYDDTYVQDYPLVAKLRRCWIGDALPWAGTRYTAELVIAAMHPVILHQRDELARCSGPEPVIVDSFFYKALSACALLGVTHQPTFDYWRSFPRPRGVVYLDVPPEVAWERAGQGSRVSRFEHYGETASWDGFARMQTDLRARMLAEVEGLPVTVVDGTGLPDAVVAGIVAAVGEAAC